MNLPKVGSILLCQMCRTGNHYTVQVVPTAYQLPSSVFRAKVIDKFIVNNQINSGLILDVIYTWNLDEIIVESSPNLTNSDSKVLLDLLTI